MRVLIPLEKCYAIAMLRFLPWRFFVKRAARHYGVLDPSMLLARIRRFAQPSEVAEPLELLRAGIVFHARGLVNSKAIQHNLDWVWPYWVERQFNPESRSFIPRAFSFSHINLTHRNWTAVGRPGLAAYPIVDPRGLVTPLEDGWSLDFWIITDAYRLLPSKLENEGVRQRLELDPTLEVQTDCVRERLRLGLATRMEAGNGGAAEVLTRIRAESDVAGWLVAAVRPYNPEGIQFINRIAFDSAARALRVNEEGSVTFDSPPDSLRMAHYAQGDVSLDLDATREQTEVDCGVGMATAAALFRLDPGRVRELNVSVGLERDLKHLPAHADASLDWSEATAGCAELRIPDGRMQFLYDAAVRTLLLLSADDLVPGPYTYRRFWFRDACLMLHPLIAIGEVDRAARILGTFPGRQTMAGYFSSQEGEWDSNGQVLWIAARYVEMTGRKLDHTMEKALRKAVAWLERKRLPDNPGKLPAATAGLLPAGFSAEHLGPNDYYYWDDFWAVGGLEAMADYWRNSGQTEIATKASRLADQFATAIDRSIEAIPERRARGAIPAAPGRRLDAGAIGSMVADYPLLLRPPGDPQMLRTAEFLMEHCFHKGGFFQEMIHSGINAYLTLDLAQTLLRAGDPRYADLMRQVADLASPTGQWPEAIHSLTLGGCMGDGQHGWAAAEWIMMIRNCFVREEKDRLILGSGVLPEWMQNDVELVFGPTLTAWGPVTVRIDADHRLLTLEGEWRGDAPAIEVAIPGFDSTAENRQTYRLHPAEK